MDHASGALAPEATEAVQVGDASWQRAQWRGLVQGVVRLMGVVKVLADRPAGQGRGQHPPVTSALADQGFKSPVVSHGADLGIDVQVVERNPADRGLVPQPKRWVVEQALGILSFRRRLVRDYEHRPASSASRAYWAMTDVMARRITGTSRSWRAA
jgi:hypothetical protein